MGANWNTFAFPTAADNSFVNNGGAAVADRTSPLYAGDPVANDLSVGVRTSPVAGPPNSTGTVELADLNLAVSDDLNVGVVDTVPGLFHNATGMLSSVAGGNSDGDVTVQGQVAIGHLVGGPVAATATGSVDLAGDLTGGDLGDLIVGLTAGAGSADGAATIAENVLGFNNVYVGRAFLMSTGDATGDLTIGGTATAGSTPDIHIFQVGSQAGDGQSVGTAEVGGGIFGFSHISVGAGSTAGAVGASATGTLDVLAGGIQVATGSEFSVGATNGPGDVNGTANVAGGVSGFAIVDVGHARQQTSTGDAAGVLHISSGGLAGANTNDLIVGLTAGAGSADGAATIAENVLGFNNVYVGRAFLMSTGDATGDLTIGGTATAGSTPDIHIFQVGSQAGDGQSVGTAEVGGGIFGFSHISVGAGSTAGAVGASATGTLDVLAGGIQVATGSEFSVGATNGPGDVNGTANVAGGVSGFAIVDVGHARQQTSTGDAAGVLHISSGGLAGANTNDLIVGLTAGAGSADGAVNVTGNLSGYREIFVGHTTAGSTGAAHGELRLDNGTATGGNMLVGVSEGAGAADGAVELNQTLVDLAGDLTLGTASSLILHIDGLNRGSQYSAIDAAAAALDGTLDVLFEFLPPGGTHHFDLIRGEESGSAISGDFDVVSVSGLSASFTYSTDIVTETIGGQSIAIYRLTVTEIPEPATGWLLVFGVAIFLSSRVSRR